MRKIIPLLCLLNFSVAFAIEDTPENRLREAKRYTQAAPPTDLFSDMERQVARSAPPDQQAAVKSAFNKHLDLAAITKALQDAMVKNFTADELSALADFYGSPVGKSAMKKFNTYIADVMPAVRSEMMKAAEKAEREWSKEPNTAPNPNSKLPPLPPLPGPPLPAPRQP